MSAFSVEIVRVEVEPHPQADRLDLVKVRGWQCVSRKGMLKTGDLAVYLPVDSVLPAPLVAHLNIEKMYSRHLRTVKLRGYISQGMVVPFHSLPRDMFVAGRIPEPVLGLDLAEALGITKYDPPIPVNMSGIQLPDHENFHKYTDIENIKSHPTGVFNPGELVVVTEKIHGCLRYDTMIYLADGTKRSIKSIVDSDEPLDVFGMDETGNIVATPVLRRYNNGVSKEWFRVKFRRAGLNKGNSFGAIYCTPEHEFFDPETGRYREASSLRPQDSVLAFRSGQQEVISVDRLSLSATRYDLETGTHNFVADGVLVHNSNARAAKIEGKLLVGSHRLNLVEADGNLYWRAAKMLGAYENLKEGEQIFFEVYGHGIQDLTYGKKAGEIAVGVFDVMKDTRYLDYADYNLFCRVRGWGELMAPTIALETWSPDMAALAAGQSILAPGQMREGVVIKPAVERFSECLQGRCIVKSINDEYLLREGGTENH